MLLPINRVYLSGIEVRILLNTNYITRIEPAFKENVPIIRTRIIMPGLSRREAQVLYSSYEISYIKGLLTSAYNRRQEMEDE